MIVNAVCKATSTLSGNESFRIPFGLFFVIPVFVMCLIFFIPEVRSRTAFSLTYNIVADCLYDSPRAGF